MAYEFDIAGRVALVTGASGGLGLRAAKVLASQGARVVMAARRTDMLESAAREIVASGGLANAVTLDVASVQSINDTAERIEGEIGPIEILVNNAGVSRQVSVLDVDEAHYDWIMNTNAKGALFMAQAAARQMIRHGIAGRIVNIGSVAAQSNLPNLTVYSMSKAAISQLTRSLALALAVHNINVNCISPGWISTSMSGNFPNTIAGKHMISRLPRGRSGVPEDLDAALLLLCSGTPSRLLTGITLPIDDGYSIA